MEPSSLNNMIINQARTDATVVTNESMSTIQKSDSIDYSVLNSGSWPLIGIWAGSSFSLIGGFLIVWQNLKRMGKVDDAKKFILLSFLLIPLILLLANIVRVKNMPLGLLPSLWLILKYFSKDKNWYLGPKPLLRWEIIKWGLLGVLIELPFFITMLLLSK